MVAPPDGEHALLTPVEALGRLLQPVLVQALPHPVIPNLDAPVNPRRRHPVPHRRRVDRDRADGRTVREQFHLRGRDRRGPQGDGPVLVPEVDKGVVRVLRHRVARAEFRAVLGDELARRRVLVLEETRVALRVCAVVRELRALNTQREGTANSRWWRGGNGTAETPSGSPRCGSSTGAPRAPACHRCRRTSSARRHRTTRRGAT